MKKPDPIIDRIRATRIKLAAELGNDPARILAAGRVWKETFEAERNQRKVATTKV